MVYFCCDGCNETLKKNQVDGHAARCRSCHSVSCVDCSVSFFGDDYRSHTTCMTEVERYEKRPPTKKVKTSPQEQWMELIRSSVAGAPPALKQHLQTIAGLDNAPRKEKQFRNFASNSLNLRGSQDKAAVVDSVWKFLSGAREKQISENAGKGSSKEQKKSVAQVSDSLKERETSKVEAQCHLSGSTVQKGERSSSSGVEPDKKSVKRAMRHILKKANGDMMKRKKLRKAVLEHLRAPTGSLSNVKHLMKLALKDKKFLVDGKHVGLQVEHK